jgi:hypothetical protein
MQQRTVADDRQRQRRRATRGLGAGDELGDASAGFRQQGHGGPLSGDGRSKV